MALTQVNLTNMVSGVLPVANGGTGLTTLASGRVPYGAGTSAFGSSSTFVFDGTNLGIGTATPNRKLTLEKTAAVGFGAPYAQVGYSSFTTGGYYTVGFGFTDATYTNPPVEIGAIATSASGGTTADLVFALRNVTTNTAPTEYVRINTSGNVVLKGGTTTATGVGISFPSAQSASSNANCLDDYEEGSYNPTDTSSGGLNLSTITVSYIKIGRQVWCSVDGYYPSTSDANYASFTLPFTASAISGGGVLTHGGSTAGTRFIVVPSATNRVSIYPSTGNTPVTNAQMSFSTIYGGFTYIAAA